jgi:hypothetical protein
VTSRDAGRGLSYVTGVAGSVPERRCGASGFRPLARSESVSRASTGQGHEVLAHARRRAAGAVGQDAAAFLRGGGRAVVADGVSVVRGVLRADRRPVADLDGAISTTSQNRAFHDHDVTSDCYRTLSGIDHCEVENSRAGADRDGPAQDGVG